MRRDSTWIPTVITGTGRIKCLNLTNLTDKDVTLDRGPVLGWSMAADMVPRYPIYVFVGSRRSNEWKTLAFEATTEKERRLPQEYVGPLVNHSPCPTPKKCLSRPKEDNEARDSPIRDEEVVPRLAPLPRVMNTIEEKGGGDRAPERSGEGGEVIKGRNIIQDRMTNRVT